MHVVPEIVTRVGIKLQCVDLQVILTTLKVMLDGDMVAERLYHS